MWVIALTVLAGPQLSPRGERLIGHAVDAGGATILPPPHPTPRVLPFVSELGNLCDGSVG